MADNFTKAGKTVLDMDYLNEVINNKTSSSTANQKDRIEAVENKLIDQGIEISYLQQRKSNSSDSLLEPFFDESLTNTDYSPSYPAKIMDDTHLDNNWKRRESKYNIKICK